MLVGLGILVFLRKDIPEVANYEAHVLGSKERPETSTGIAICTGFSDLG